MSESKFGRRKFFLEGRKTNVLNVVRVLRSV